MQKTFTKAIGFSLFSLGLCAGLTSFNPAQALAHSPAANPVTMPGKTTNEMSNQISGEMPGEMAQPMSDSSFRVIEQPVSIKLSVTIAAFTLIGLELWWFLGRSRRRKTS